MKQAGIYSFVNLVNGKRYIGQAVDIDKRILSHSIGLKSGHHDSPKLQNAWNKYGYQNFIVETLISTDNDIPKKYLKVFLDFLEKYYIEEYDSKKSGYNCTIGGDGALGLIHSPTARHKMSEIRKKMIGSKNPLYGRKFPKTSERMKGAGNPMFGKCGDKSPSFGVIRNDMCGENSLFAVEVILISPEGKEIKMKSYHQFCKDNQLTTANICKVLSGERKHHKGWTGRYLETKNIGGNLKCS